MKFLKKLFKREKKYKLTLTEDDIFYTVVPAVYTWYEEVRKDGEENDYNDDNKEILEKTMKNCVEVIVKIRKARGIIK